jgi:hypothetical protein
VSALPDETFRVALSVRNLERILPRARLAGRTTRNAHWTQLTAFYLKDAWCWAALTAELDDLRWYAVSPPHEGRKEHLDEIGPFYDALEALTGTKESLSRVQLIEHAPELAGLMPQGSSRRRLLDRVVRDTNTPESSANWLGRLGRDFDKLLARTARQRNATVHGATPSPAVIENVLGFAEGLGLQVVRSGLSAAADSIDIQRYLEEERLQQAERTAALISQTSLSELV